MFTGIVAAVGSIKSVTPLADGADAGVRLAIDAGGLPLGDVALGDSIAINGACMTVVDKSDNAFAVDVSRESLNRTVGLDQPGEVNLEKALTLAERLGGHLVSGHVDGVAQVLSLSGEARSTRVVIGVPNPLARYIAPKGSVAVDGVSLTINAVDSAAFGVNLIPHTQAVTTLAGLAVGSRVNLEIDQVARYVARLLAVPEGK
jgi:riboflavin synthase